MFKVGLISGHGDGDCGALGCGYAEADLTIEIVKMLDKELKKRGIDTRVYPFERNAYKDIKNGYYLTEFSDCTYVLEVHFNACVDDESGDGVVTGTEIWVTPREIGVTVENKILENMEKIGFRNRGVKKTNFLVINTIKNLGISSALIETCFIDDKDDMQLFDSNKKSIVNSIADGILDGFNVEYTKEEEKEEEFKTYMVRVSIDDLNIRAGAGTDYDIKEQTGKGAFTIVDEADGKGASKWGLLKSYADERNGWISLDFAEKI